MALNMITVHTNSTTYSASVVCHSKSLCAIFGLELGLDKVGGLASVVQGELLQEALVGGLWEETLLIQQGQDAHLLHMGRREHRRERAKEEEGQTRTGRRGPCVHMHSGSCTSMWLYMKHSLPIIT